MLGEADMKAKEKKATAPWKINAFYVDSCNCDWGCPCQFQARPTNGNCEGSSGFLIRSGNYGNINLDGLSAASIISYPGAVHEGHGEESIYIDEKANEDQFQALGKITTGEAGGGPFPIYASTCDEVQEPRRARIRIEPKGLRSRVVIEGILEIELEPIANSVTREPFRAIIELPDGFEANRMEQASSRKLRANAGKSLTFVYHDTYGSISEVTWKGP